MTKDSPPWLPEDMLCLAALSTLKKVQTIKGYWLGAYQGIPSGLSQGGPILELLCASRSPSVLSRKLKELGAQFPIFVRRAPSKDKLPIRIEPVQPDRFAQLRRSAYEAVGQARRTLDPDSFLLPFVPLNGYEWFVYELMSFRSLITESEAKSLHKALRELYWTLVKIEDRARSWNLNRPDGYSDLANEFVGAIQTQRGNESFHVANSEAQSTIEKFLAKNEEIVTKRFEKMRQAADFLHSLGNMCRSKGEKAGDRATGTETRKVLTVLDQLAKGNPLKAITQIATDGQVDDLKSLRSYKSADRLVFRFSKRLAKAVYQEYGSGITSLDYNHLFHALRDWPWIDRRRDRLALMEAARRGLPLLRFV